jgi:transposase
LVFGVSVGWAEKICRQHRLSGQPERIEQRHGPTSRVDAAAQACLLDAIKERPDLTLAELQEILASAIRSKPSAFQAESFQPPCWIMARWWTTSRTAIVYGM